MKRISWLVISAMLLAISAYAEEAQQVNTMRGWLCNSSCVKQESGHASRDRNCADKAGDVVLIEDGGQVLTIVNQDKVKSYAGKKVKMKCKTMGSDGSMYVDTVSLYGGGG